MQHQEEPFDPSSPLDRMHRTLQNMRTELFNIAKVLKQEAEDELLASEFKDIDSP